MPIVCGLSDCAAILLMPLYSSIIAIRIIQRKTIQLLAAANNFSDELKNYLVRLYYQAEASL